MQLPATLHFYAAAPAVSLELPVGFEALAPTETGRAFVRYDDDDEEIVALVTAQLLGESDGTGPATAISALAAHGVELARETITVDGEQLTRADLRFPAGLPQDPKVPLETPTLLSGDVTVTVAAGLINGRVVMVLLASVEPDQEYVADVLASCRFVGGAGDFDSDDDVASLTVADLGLSLRAPLGWDIEYDEALVRLRGPMADGRQPTFAIRAGAPAEPGEAWFADFREGAVARMPDSVPGFALLGREDFVLSSWVDVTAVTYRREEPAPLSQLQAYLWADSYRMYVVDAATAREHEDRDLPVFDKMLRSIRLIPANS